MAEVITERSTTEAMTLLLTSMQEVWMRLTGTSNMRDMIDRIKWDCDAMMWSTALSYLFGGEWTLSKYAVEAAKLLIQGQFDHDLLSVAALICKYHYNCNLIGRWGPLQIPQPIKMKCMATDLRTNHYLHSLPLPPGPKYKNSFQRLDNMRQILAELIGMTVWWTYKDLNDWLVIDLTKILNWKWNTNGEQNIIIQSLEEIQEFVNTQDAAYKKAFSGLQALEDTAKDNVKQFYCVNCKRHSELSNDDIDGIPLDHYGLVNCVHCGQNSNYLNTSGKIKYQIVSRLPLTPDINGPTIDRPLITCSVFRKQSNHSDRIVRKYNWYHHSSHVGQSMTFNGSSSGGSSSISTRRLLEDNPWAKVLGMKEITKNGKKVQQIVIQSVLNHFKMWPMVYPQCGFRSFIEDDDPRNGATNHAVEQFNCNAKYGKKETLLTHSGKTITGMKLTYTRVKLHLGDAGPLSGNGKKRYPLNREQHAIEGRDGWNKTPCKDDHLETLWNQYTVQNRGLPPRLLIEKLDKGYKLNMITIPSYDPKLLRECIVNKRKHPSRNRAYTEALTRATTTIFSRKATHGGAAYNMTLPNNDKYGKRAYKKRRKKKRK